MLDRIFRKPLAELDEHAAGASGAPLDDEADMDSSEPTLAEQAEDLMLRYPLCTLGAVFAAGVLAGACLGRMAPVRRHHAFW